MITIVNLKLTNAEWYFLHIQIENIIKNNPDNHVAKSILEKLAQNCPELDSIKSDFKVEYESQWIGNEE